MALTNVRCRPGDVKDFVKKIKQEDLRIEMRRKMLIKQAERIAQARAKAQQAAASKEGAASTPNLSAVANSSPTSPAIPSSTSASSQDGLKPPGTPTLLHPSLPAKPGANGENAAASPGRVSTPNPQPAAPATPTPSAPAPEPAPIVLPPDEQIMKHEEVSSQITVSSATLVLAVRV